jgi:arabinofuranosyltransferase
MMSLLAIVVLLLGIGLHRLAVDDAFITYRYAQNLATGKGLAYNVGRPTLSTTAPLYALILAAGAWLWPDPSSLPVVANGLSAVALWVAAGLVFFLGRREGTPWVGALAALFQVAYPLLWLSLGLETALFLALGLGALTAYRRGRLPGAAILLALATMTRGDGLVLAAVVAADYALSWLAHRRTRTMAVLRELETPGALRRGLGAAVVYVAVMLPLLAWLVWQFGSPLPATLEAKVSQAKLGVTGFYAHTTYLQGLGILARARMAQSPLYVLFVPAVVAGVIVMWRRAGWVRLIVAWGAAHLLGYTLLGVSPYYWYYAPLVPAFVCAAALGIVEISRALARRGARRAWGASVLWAAALLLALARSDWAMAQALDGPVPAPDDPVSKVLPEAKAGPYEQAGRWLRHHTPASALVGVTELGIMGYYAGRPMVDFLGLLEPDVSTALARGDLYWALLRYQPDYLALTAVSPLYAYDLRADPWFQAAYEPVQAFDDPRFWGSPLTVYGRKVSRGQVVELAKGDLPAGAARLDADFGHQIRLLGAVAGASTAHPGDVLPLTLYWQALGPVDVDYTVFVHLLGRHDRVIAQRDAPPGLGAQPTSRWASGQVIADPYLLVLPEAAYAPDEAVWEVGLYEAATGRRLHTVDGGDNVRFGTVSVPPATGPVHLDFGPAALIGYELDRLALGPGEALHVTLHWEGDRHVQVTVQLVNESGQVAARAKGRLSQEAYVLSLGAGAPHGAYDLEVLVNDPGTGQALSLLGADGHPKSDRARLTKVRLYP